MTDRERVTDGLRAWAGTHDNHVCAAVELLIWHEYWLLRADFVKACTEQVGRVRVIRWQQVNEFIASGVRCSTAELNILRLAVALGQDEFGWSKFGHAHRGAVLKAVTTALGLTPEAAF